MDKMDLWNKVCKTDPRHTKQVNQRGGFTSIDAMYQVQRATEQFGPAGYGWGYECTHSIADFGVHGVLAFCDVVLWWSNSDDEHAPAFKIGPVRGCNALITDKGRLDEDAPKKALTDALTKALSHLGFSADVFLGLYDDNKYVARLKSEFGGSADKPAEDMAWAKTVATAIAGAGSMEKLGVMEKKLNDMYEGRDSKAVEFIKAQLKTTKQSLGEKA